MHFYISVNNNMILFLQETHEFDLHKLKTDLSEYITENFDMFLRRTHDYKEGL